MRVHELAKQLDISSKDICQFLTTDEKVYKTMSGITEEEAERVRAKFGTSATAPAPSGSKETVEKADKKPEAKQEEKKEIKEDKKEEKKAEKIETKTETEAVSEPENNKYPEKKKDKSKEKSHKITQIFIPQNSSKGGQGGKRRDNRGPKDRNAQGGRNPQVNPYARTPGMKPRPTQSERLEAQRLEEEKKRQAEGVPSESEPKKDTRPIEHRNRSEARAEKRFSKPQIDLSQAQNQPSEKSQGRKGDNRKSGGKHEYERRKDEEKENLNFTNQKKNKHDKKKDKEKEKEKVQAKPEQPVEKPKKKDEPVTSLTLPDYLTIKQLAEMLKKAPAQLVKDLFLKGKVVTINQEIDFDTAEEIALDYDCLCEREEKVDVIAELLKEEEEDESKMTERPPVVAVMGHVDHGKTSLLDAIRKTNVTDKESGGITQKIGAYQVKTGSGRTITFLDTPGHEAFTSMRMRGAQSTDIAILVVAADDGVMPQTVEAINHAKAAGVEIIVAVNKIDKPSANVDRVKQELMEHELIPEEWGGTTVFCPVSAHSGEGIDDLLEMIMLTADVLELKANKKRMARGIVIEAELDKGRGVVATALVQKGTLHVGDSVAAGSSFGKIRAMLNDHSKRIKEAGPSTPVEILGLNEVPNAGEILIAFGNDKEARSFAGAFVSEEKKKLVDESRHRMSLDDLFDQIKAGNLKELKIIVKADVQGSVEAIKQSLEKLSNDEVVVKIIHGGVGNINESDVILASASNAIILGFNVKPDNRASATAETEEVDVRLYSVIYDAIDDVEAALKGMLEPVYEERVIGHAEIKQIFKASGIGNIAGAIVTDGRVTSKAMVKITRDGEQIYEGRIASLKHFKDEVKEVKGGTECGLVFEDFDKIAEGDLVEASEMFEIPRK